MKLFEREYQGVTYIFETTNKARVEIKDMTMANIKDFSAGEYLQLTADIKQAQIEGERIDKMPDGEEKERLYEILNTKLTDLADKSQAMMLAVEQKDISTLDFMYIILKNTRQFKGHLDRNLYDDIIYDMEDELGDIETFKIMEEAKQKAFTVFKEMTELEDKMKNPKPKKKKSQVSKTN